LKFSESLDGAQKTPTAQAAFDLASQRDRILHPTKNETLRENPSPEMFRSLLPEQYFKT